MAAARERQYVAVDLGGETGRIVIGGVAGAGIAVREVHRFATGPVRTPDGLHTNVLGIFGEILHGLERAFATTDGEIVSIGVDSWGVDYGLFGRTNRLLGIPYHYRDARTDGVGANFAHRVSAERQYARTGIAQMSINTLYQLIAHARDEETLAQAEVFAMLPDIMHYWLSGVHATELTNASTTGALAIDGSWAGDLFDAIDVPQRIFHQPVEPGTSLGPTRRELGLGRGGGDVRIVVPATHDTACAVIAAPLHVAPAGGVCAFISSGTWSLLGVEIARPIVTEAARVAGFTNERGVGGSTRFLRNIMGLWLVQESRRAWRRAGDEVSYEDLCAAAGAIASPELVIDVNDAALLHPADMPAAIRTQLAQSGQPNDANSVTLTRAIFEGLALEYRRSIADVERLAGVTVGAIAIVGGGARNALLCQLAADACERPVYAGPAEGTATGNILLQAVADRSLSGLAEIRAFVELTGSPQLFAPRSTAVDWSARDAALTAGRAARLAHAHVSPGATLHV